MSSNCFSSQSENVAENQTREKIGRQKVPTFFFKLLTNIAAGVRRLPVSVYSCVELLPPRATIEACVACRVKGHSSELMKYLIDVGFLLPGLTG